MAPHIPDMASPTPSPPQDKDKTHHRHTLADVGRAVGEKKKKVKEAKGSGAAKNRVAWRWNAVDYSLLLQNRRKGQLFTQRVSLQAQSSQNAARGFKDASVGLSSQPPPRAGATPGREARRPPRRGCSCAAPICFCQQLRKAAPQGIRPSRHPDQ